MTGWARQLFPGRPRATAEQARDLQQQGAILLDVREDAEWQAGHAPKARHGREVVNLSGGMRAWARAGLPVVAAGGHPGRVA